MRSKEAEAATQAIEDAKVMIEHHKFEDAKAKIQEAINLFPTIQHGQEMITLCEIRHLCQTHKSSRTETWWPYTLLQIPTSSTYSEVQSRYQKLSADLCILGDKFIGRRIAWKQLNSAMIVYNRNYLELGSKKRKTSSPSSSSQVPGGIYLSDEEDDDLPLPTRLGISSSTYFSDEEDDDLPLSALLEISSNAYFPDEEDDDLPFSDEEDDYDLPLSARLGISSSTYFPKQTLEPLPQQKPHFSPLAKYCGSVRQEMRLGFDKIFVKLTQKLQSLSGDQILSHNEEETIKGELSNLEEMGYDVKKFKERFDLLVRVKALAKEAESYEGKRRNLEGQVGSEMLQLKKVQSRISELNSEIQVVKAQNDSVKSEMASLKAKLSNNII